MRAETKILIMAFLLLAMITFALGFVFACNKELSTFGKIGVMSALLGNLIFIGILAHKSNSNR